MNRSSSAREALLAEAIGDVATLLNRIEATTPVVEAARLSLVQASEHLAAHLASADSRMANLTENAKLQAVRHIARRTDEMTRSSVQAQTRALADAAQALFRDGAGAELRQLADRIGSPWERWLTHAATAVASSAVTLAVVTWPWSR